LQASEPKKNEDPGSFESGDFISQPDPAPGITIVTGFIANKSERYQFAEIFMVGGESPNVCKAHELSTLNRKGILTAGRFLAKNERGIQSDMPDRDALVMLRAR
jgi:hypothetical protein